MDLLPLHQLTYPNLGLSGNRFITLIFIFIFIYGGPGGIRTPVQDTFLFASYDHNLETNHFQFSILSNNSLRLIVDFDLFV